MCLKDVDVIEVLVILDWVEEIVNECFVRCRLMCVVRSCVEVCYV